MGESDKSYEAGERVKVRVQNIRLQEQIEALATKEKISAEEANALVKDAAALDPSDQKALASFLAEHRDSFGGAESMSPSLRSFISEQSSKSAHASKAHALRASFSSEAPESGHWWSALTLPLGQIKVAPLDELTESLLLSLASQSQTTQDGTLVVGNKGLLDEAKMQAILN